MIHPEMSQHFMLALDRHKQLLEEAERYRARVGMEKLIVGRPRRWRWIRFRVGELLVSMGQRLKADAVWG